MRFYFVTTVCAFLFLFTGAASAEDARALLDRAIQAHGGAARLERTKKGHLKGKCDASFAYEIEEWFDLPARTKRILEGISNGTPFYVEYFFMGKEGWKRERPKPVQHFSMPESLTSVGGQWYAVLAQLLLLREKDVQLTTLPEETKDGRTLAGVHAVYSQRSSDYFFDKSTGFLERSKGTTPNPEDGQEQSVEILYDDYRDIQGIHYPMRFRVTVKDYSSTITLSAIEFLDKIDDSIFAEPTMTPAAEAPTAGSNEKSSEQRNRVLIVVTIVAGVIIGAVWFIVRASKRGKQELPPS